MAHSLSAEKRIRQNVKRNAQNRSRRAVLKSTMRSTHEALSSGGSANAQQVVKEAVQILDREANRRTLHRNAAARRKSKLMKKLNTLKAAGK